MLLDAGIMNEKVQLYLDVRSELGECPCWDEKYDKLFWIDTLRCELYIYNSHQNSLTTFPTDSCPGSYALCETERLLLATQKGIGFLEIKNGYITYFCNPESDKNNNRFNDGKCDPYGRFWVGTMDENGATGKGSLYCVHADLRIKKVLSNISVSNGMAWSPDNKTMYYIDSPQKSVFSFDYDLESGDIKNRRVAIDTREIQGLPDGMTIDADGMLWVAMWGGEQIVRWNPQTGKLLSTVPIPTDNVTSCTFGGKNMDELFITTARTGLSAKDLLLQPHAGGVFRFKTSTNGFKTNRFGG